MEETFYSQNKQSMLQQALILDNLRMLSIEYLQSKEEGKDMKDFHEKIELLQQSKLPFAEKEIQAGVLLEQMYNLPIAEDFKYTEPSTYEEILSLRPKFSYQSFSSSKKKEIQFDNIYGAWLGRSIGCLAGLPIEGWTCENINNLLRETDNFPLNRYLSSDLDIEIRAKYFIEDYCFSDQKTPSSIYWINNVSSAPVDDDLNYTIAGLDIIETFGVEFTPDDVAYTWLRKIPLMHLYTAERIAYRNLAMYKFPPYSAQYRNSYREWIGAQIRGDFWGYINPGNIEKASEMAFRDASISHEKNGIYGEMFVAAAIAAAAVSDDMEFIIKCGLSQIPYTSRFSEGINYVLDNWKAGTGQNLVLNYIHSRYDEKSMHHWCHVLSNSMIVCMALLYGDKDFDKSLSLAITSGFDCDCNAATVGSIVGLIIGANRIPEKWILPLNDTLLSAVQGFEKSSIRSLAERTIKCIKD